MIQSHIVIANDLRTGRSVYLNADDRWTDDVSDAVTANDQQEIDRLLAMAVLGVQRCEILDPQAIPVTENTDPIVGRDAIRVLGPSVNYAGNPSSRAQV